MFGVVHKLESKVGKCLEKTTQRCKSWNLKSGKDWKQSHNEKLRKREARKQKKLKNDKLQQYQSVQSL